MSAFNSMFEDCLILDPIFIPIIPGEDPADKFYDQNSHSFFSFDFDILSFFILIPDKIIYGVGLLCFLPTYTDKSLN